MSVDIHNPSRAYSNKVNTGKVSDPGHSQTQNSEIADLLEKLKGLVNQEMTKALATQKGPAGTPPKAQTPANAVKPPVVAAAVHTGEKTPAPTTAKALFAPGHTKTPGTPAAKPATAGHPETKPVGSGTPVAKPAPTSKAIAKPEAHVGAPGKTGGASKVNLSHFGMLQLPTGKQGSPDTITGGRLEGFGNSAFERHGDGSISLNVPQGGGVHTANSKYPRSELGENKTWSMNKGTSKLESTMSVDKLPKNGTIVIGQIHQRTLVGGAPRPPLELVYKNGNIVANMMDKNAPGYTRKDVVIATGVKPGEKFSFSMQVQPGGKVNITAAGQSKSVQFDKSFGSSAMYFKTGNYCQDPSGGSSVRLYGAEISHS